MTVDARHALTWLDRSLRTTSLGAVAMCVALWVRAKTVDQAERGNAERRALFVGLWPSMLWLVADSVEGLRTAPSRNAAR